MKLIIVVLAAMACLAQAGVIKKPESVEKAKPRATPFSNLKRYSVSGVIELPYAEISEPFRAWYDSDQYASRIDYYDGMVSTIQLAPTTSTTYGTGIKVAPMTDEVQTNVKTCFWINGTKDSPLTLQSVIPDTTDFSVGTTFAIFIESRKQTTTKKTHSS